METCPLFAKAVCALLERYRTRAWEAGIHLALHSDELFLAPEGDVTLRVSYVVGGSAPYKDLELWFWVEGPHWVPYQIYRATVGTRAYGAPDAAMRQLLVTDNVNQAALARYCESWSFHLREQGWFDQAQRLPYLETDARLHPKWPEPTVEPPDLATLEAWFGEDDDCEASDGCVVEPDGMCPHGHPSWLRRLGFM